MDREDGGGGGGGGRRGRMLERMERMERIEDGGCDLAWQRQTCHLDQFCTLVVFLEVRATHPTARKV